MSLVQKAAPGHAPSSAKQWQGLATVLLMVSLLLNCAWVFPLFGPVISPYRTPADFLSGQEDFSTKDSIAEIQGATPSEVTQDLNKSSADPPASALSPESALSPTSRGEDTDQSQPDQASKLDSKTVMEYMRKLVEFPGSEVCGPWHRKYTEFHQRVRRGEIPDKQRKYITFQTTNNGLGDNLLGLVTTFISALVSNRAFVIAPSFLDAAFEPAEIDWRPWDGVPLKETTSYRQHLNEESVFTMKRLNTPLHGHTFQTGYTSYPEDIKEYFQLLKPARNVVVYTNGGLLSRIFGRGRGLTFQALHRMGLRLPYAFGCIIRYLLKPKAEVMELLQGPMQALHANSSSVCVHLRTADNLAWSKGSQDIVKATEVAEAMLICARRFSEMWLPASRHVKWLFMSDSQQLVTLMQQKHPDKVMISSLKPVHVAFTGSAQGWQTTVADWLLFSSCDAHILSESGFSKSASAYNYLTPHRLLLPLRLDMGLPFHKYAVIGCSGATPSSLLDFRKWSGF